MLPSNEKGYLNNKGEGMGLFERTHLPDQISTALWCGPIRGLHGDGFMVSITFLSSRLQ